MVTLLDLEYPSELHDMHNDFPLAPENIRITEDMLSRYNTKLAKKNELNTNSNIKKLCPNLMNKEKYIIHYKLLQQCVEMGMVITKVHRLLRFNQGAWMKPYIDYNIEKRERPLTILNRTFTN